MKLFVYDKNKKKPLFVLLILCFFIRIGYQWLNLNIPYFKVTTYGVIVDEYGAIAENLARGKGFSYLGAPTASRPPLYPVILALFYKIFGIWRGYSLIFQAVCDTMSCFFIFLLAERIFDSYRHAFLAALLWTIYIPGISLTVLLYSEPLFIAQLTLFCYSLMVITDDTGIEKWSFLGLQLGLLFLCRPSALFLLPVITLYLMVSKENKNILKAVSVIFLTSALTVAPWVVRNYYHSKRLIFGTTRLGITLCHSRNLLNDKEAVQEIGKLKQPYGIVREDEINSIYQKKFLKRWKKVPTLLLTGGIKRMLSLYLHTNRNLQLRSIKSIFVIGTNFVFLVLAGITIWKYRGKWLESFVPFWWLLGYFHLLAFFPAAHWRHNMPNIPFLIILAVPALGRFLGLAPLFGSLDRGDR